MSLIELQDVDREYAMDGNSVVVLRGVNLRVESAEFVAVVGPSGSGKSTLLNLIGGLDRVTRGSLRVDGVDLSHAADAVLDAHRRERVGFVFQAFHVNPRRTALENVTLPLVFGDGPGGADATQMARGLLRDVGIEDLADRRASTLSGGQKQRVAIARALVRTPRILLADEPVGNLDAATGRGIVELLLQLNRERGLTIIAVSHDLLLLQSATRMLEMEDGRLLEGPAPEHARESIER